MKTVRIKNLIREFFLDSSMPGLKYIGQDNRHRLERILWVFMFFLGVCTSGFMCYGLLKKFYSSPVTMSVESADASLSNFLFPSVTICNQNKISMRKLNKLMQIPRYKKFTSKQMVLMMRVMIKIDAAFNRNEELVAINEIMTKNEISVQEVINITIDSMVSCDEMLLDCQWKNQIRPCSELFELRPTDDGICCGFNPIETGWTLNGRAAARETERLSFPGHSIGLKVVMDGDLDDYASSTGRSNGFKVLIHNPTEYPEVGERGFFISPGFEVNSGLNPMTSYATVAVKELSLDQRLCYTESENLLRYYGNYSVSRCLIECLTNKMLEMCNCRPYYYAGDPGDVICQLENYVCLNDAFNVVRETDTFSVCKMCYPACKSYWYFNELSMASFPGELFLASPLGQRIQKKKANMSKPDLKKYLKKNGALLNVFYKETSGYIYRSDVRFGIEDFISGIGGLLGLGFGCSVISAIEVVVHFIYCLVVAALPVRV